MSDSAGSRFLKENWWLLIALVVLIAGAIVFALRGEAPEEQQVTEDAPRPAAEVTNAQVDIARDKPAQEAKRLIDEYDEQVEAEPDHEDTPARIQAAANLYMTKLKDFEQAAFKYQVLLDEYPEYEGNRTVYPNLEYCFREMEDNAGLTYLFELMIEREPPNSNEVEYAKVQLGIISEEEAREERDKRDAERDAERIADPDAMIDASAEEAEETESANTPQTEATTEGEAAPPE